MGENRGRSRRAACAALTGVLLCAAGVEDAAPQDSALDARQLQRAVMVDAARARAEDLRAYRADGFDTVVLEVRSAADVEANAAAARRVRAAKLGLSYWIEVARNESMADAHPEWMCSVQGHRDWRRLHEGVEVGQGELVKVYPWVPILYEETFAAHLARIERLLAGLPEPDALLLNDLQGGPSACGCGSGFCRWTSDYGPVATATPYRPEDEDHAWPAVVCAAADFVQAVQGLAPETEVVPIWLTECEQHDRPELCGTVGCYAGYCWHYYESQLDRLTPHVERLGALATYKALGRDQPVYGETAGWVRWVLGTYSDLPRGYRWRRDPELRRSKKIVVEARRLLPILQGWDVTAEEVAAQVRIAEEAGVGGYVLGLVPIDQSWRPRVVRVQ